jgi:DNA-binding CsgD family transcriptional regulator
MLNLLVYLLFIVSVALAALGIILSSKLKTRYRSEIFSSLLYFQVFIYTFGFYGIWGHVILKTFMSEVVQANIIERFSDIAMLLGLPFLVFAWMMLIRFTAELSGRKFGSWGLFWYLMISFSLIFIAGYFIAREKMVKPVTMIKYYYIIMNLAITFIASYLIHIPLKKRAVIHDYDRRMIAPVMFVIMILQCVAVVFYASQIWLGILFVIAFFTGNIFLPVYFSYVTLISGFEDVPEKSYSFGEFCKKYEVSPRESEIVREICNGLSNKEISEKLFISLQTVKDHTHHIYIKTNVKSRVQLITLVKEQQAS